MIAGKWLLLCFSLCLCIDMIYFRLKMILRRLLHVTRSCTTIVGAFYWFVFCFLFVVRFSCLLVIESNYLLSLFYLVLYSFLVLFCLSNRFSRQLLIFRRNLFASSFLFSLWICFVNRFVTALNDHNNLRFQYTEFSNPFASFKGFRLFRVLNKIIYTIAITHSTRLGWLVDLIYILKLFALFDKFSGLVCVFIFNEISMDCFLFRFYIFWFLQG